MQTEFLESLGTRMDVEESAMNHRAGVSEAAALATLIKHWFLGSPQQQVFSLGVYSDGKIRTHINKNVLRTTSFNLRKILVYLLHAGQNVYFLSGGY